MKRYLVPAALFLNMACAASVNAQGGVIIDVRPSIGPNLNGSPSFTGYSFNTINALFPGSTSPVSSPGTEGNPGAASAVAPPVVSTSQLIATSFNSWNGVASSVGPFGAERGNLLYFGASITSTNPGVFQFLLSDVSWTTSSSDGVFTDSGNFATSPFNTFSENRVGVLFGADNVAGGVGANADTFITSGLANSQLIDALYVIGSGVFGYDAGAFANQSGSNQNVINNGLAEIGAGPITYTGTYSVSQFFNALTGAPLGIPGQTGEASIVAVNPVPEPATVIGLISGSLVGLLGYKLRRRRELPVAA